MKRMKIFAVAVLAAVGSTALAQATYEAQDGTKYEFKKHAFLTLGGGAQYTLGEAGFGDLISPNVQVGLGYQFSPILAARLQANAWQSKGGWPNYRDQQFSTPYSLDYKYKYVAPGIDLMLNLSNLFCGWNPNRVFNLSLFAGGGANVAFSNDEANDINAQLGSIDGFEMEYIWDGTKVRPFGRAGLEARFRVSDAVSILLEGNANVLSDKYNSKKAGNSDWYFNALAGLRINLGKTYTKIVPPVPVEPVYEQPAPQPQPVVEQPRKPEPKPVVEKVEPLRRDIFFDINKWDIRPAEQQKVKDIADYLAKYPKAKVSLCGYADVQTGNADINERLGRQRVEAVKEALVSQYGVSPDRIVTDSKGDRVQPFPVNEDNRVTIAIAE